MDSKDSFPKTVLPKRLCLRNSPAIAPQPQAASGHCGDGLSDNFFKLNAFTFPKERLKRDFESHRGGAGPVVEPVSDGLSVFCSELNPSSQ